MAKITNKTKFVQYCLRQLGAPVINIEVHALQIDDCYDDCVRMLQDFHENGIERLYLKHQITQDDLDAGYIELPESIIGVNKCFPLTGSQTGSNYIFDLNYQIRLNDLWDLGSASISYYSMLRQYTNTLDQMFNGQPMIRFNRVQNRVYVDVATSKLKVDQFLLFEVTKALTPEEFPELFEEPWMKKYMTALIKKQWGANLKKFNNIQTIGGVVLDGQLIFNEAVQDIEDLKVELRNTYELPLNMYVG